MPKNVIEKLSTFVGGVTQDRTFFKKQSKSGAISRNSKNCRGQKKKKKINNNNNNNNKNNKINYQIICGIILFWI